jgi:UDP-glucose 4-epimerase
VIPLFQEQIRNGGPVTITIPEMTRFLLSLDQAVDTVFAAVRWADPGDTYIPGAPSATVLNIARALIGERKIETVVTGIRPGEKIHEVLVSEEEANRCFKQGDYYTIRPMLPELRQEGDLLGPCLKNEFSSAHASLNYENTVELLKKHGLSSDET